MSLDLAHLLAELTQAREEGADPGSLEAEILDVDLKDQASLEGLLQRIEALPRDEALSAAEPDDLEAILAARPSQEVSTLTWFTQADILNAYWRGWSARAAGCLMGKPCEGWSAARIEAYLSRSGYRDLDGYFPLLVPYNEPGGTESRPLNWYDGHVHEAPRDDDTDYTVLGLHILEEHGPHFTTEDVAAEWLSHLPYHQVYTAERVTYANLVNGLMPPQSATYRNPYREWIGAQIRADFWGYATAGRPDMAAALAYRDARLSHVRNGIYGEMWAAACVSAAFVKPDAEAVLLAGLDQIPAQCRLAQALRQTMEWCRHDPDWRRTFARVDAAYGHYHGVHTINNACVVALAMLHADGSLDDAMAIAVMCGWDTDCNGATVGSIMGILTPFDPATHRLTGQLNDTLRSAIHGFDSVRMWDLAERTLAQAELVLCKD